MNRLEGLPVDLFIQQITYLPFKDVNSICQTNKKFHNYCTNSKYSNNWKSLIDDTFSSVYNYHDKLNKIWDDLKIPKNTYNYLVYTRLINYLDHITQLMIYYRQDDMDSFNSDKFNDTQRVLASFLLDDKQQTAKYLSKIDFRIKIYRPFLDMMDGKKIARESLDDMITIMAANGNIRGVKLLIEKGADVYIFSDSTPLIEASMKGYLDVVKYLVEEKHVDIHVWNDEALFRAAASGHLDVVKYLVENGAVVDAAGSPLNQAVVDGHLDVVKYLVEHGANISKLTLRLAGDWGHLDILEYLKSQM